MRVAAAPRLGACLALGGLGLIAGLALGRAEPVVLGAPFLLLVALGLALAVPPDLALAATIDRERLLEGEEVELTVTIASSSGTGWLRVELSPAPGLAVSGGGPPALRLAPGATATISRRLRCARWGVYMAGELEARAADRFGLFEYRQSFALGLPIRVYPRPEDLRAMLSPAETMSRAGNQVSRAKGDGIEFADIRAFEPGDRVRRINWRVSARRGQLHVNEAHPERNADVVVFVDTFTELRRLGLSSLDMEVRAAAALVGRYLEGRDRVGLIGFGGTLRWLRPSMGLTQLYRLVDSLLDTEVVFSYAWKGIEVIPVRILPPKALVVALTPLLDERTVGALADLRGRGHDLVVVEVSPIGFTPPAGREPERLAFRLWELERETIRNRYQRLGAAVAVWDRDQPLQAVIEELRAFRRHARLARV